MAGPGFSNCQIGIILQIFCRKLHENERISTLGGVPGAPLAPPVLSVHGLWNQICIFSSRGNMSNQWRIYIAIFWMRAPNPSRTPRPRGSKFFQCSRMLASSGGLAPPPRGNPGSATANYSFLDKSPKNVGSKKWNEMTVNFKSSNFD